mmetsp:Transcript_29514/g.44878  ORF Transcript_29514/g.44878 Transcript_29514/m.44878 type:complete len:337 (-) Transcript_29514:1221-2231(-)
MGPLVLVGVPLNHLTVFVPSGLAGLDRSETAASGFGIVDAAAGCSRRGHPKGLPVLLRSAHFLGRVIHGITGDTDGGVGSSGRLGEEALAVGLVLGVVEGSVVLRVVGPRCARSHPSHVGHVCRVAVLVFPRLHHRIVQIDNQVLVDRILVGRLRLSSSSRLVVASSLGSAVVGGDTLVLGILWHIDVRLHRHARMLDGLVVHRIVAYLTLVLDRGTDEVVHELAAGLDLLRVNRRRHVQILLRLLGLRIGRLVGSMAVSRLGVVDGHGVLDVSAHAHLALEVDLGQLVVLLAVLDLAVALVNEMVTSRYVVVAVVLNAFLSVLPVEVVLLEQSVE